MPKQIHRRTFFQFAAALAVALCLAAGELLAAESARDDFLAGVARKNITPAGSICMAGFAARKGPSDGVLHDLWAKSLALQDARGQRVVIVTTDLLGLPRELTEKVAVRAKEKHGLERRQILFNSSHTHSGPIVWNNLRSLFNGNEDDQRRLVEYHDRLIDSLNEIIDAALADLKPAVLSTGRGSVDFAKNRRLKTPKGVANSLNPAGPVDHDVPVIVVADKKGRPRAVLFGYCCHNTTLTSDNLKICGDYAGFAQIEIEKALPGVNAMFMSLCAGDQNPLPRGKLELAVKYGKSLADEVRRVMADRTKTASSPILSAEYEDVKVDLARRDRKAFEEEAKSENIYLARRAKSVLAAIDAGTQSWQVTVPVQVIAFGDGAVLAALGGEVVVDYSLRLKREYPKTNLFVAGYSNDVMCYIPSRRVLLEGGYEGGDSMIYYGQPGPFAENVESTLIDACHRLLGKLGFKPESNTPNK